MCSLFVWFQVQSPQPVMTVERNLIFSAAWAAAMTSHPTLSVPYIHMHIYANAGTSIGMCPFIYPGWHCYCNVSIPIPRLALLLVCVYSYTQAGIVIVMCLFLYPGWDYYY